VINDIGSDEDEDDDVHKTFTKIYFSKYFESCCCSVCMEVFEDARILPNCGHTFCWKCIKTTAAVAFASSSAAAKRIHSGGSLLVSSAAPEIVVCPECRVSCSLTPEPLKNFVVNSFCSLLLPPPLPHHHHHHLSSSSSEYDRRDYNRTLRKLHRR
jgi:hypothetical protein